MAQSPGDGSRIQLAAIGPQDVYVVARDITASAWRRGWKRHTPFVTKIVETPMDFRSGKRVVADIPKSGDVLADVTLQLTLPILGPGTTWPPRLGHALLRRVRFLIDDAEIHNYERLWYDIYDTLYTSASHATGLDVMVGRTPLDGAIPHVLHIPLRFLTGRKGRPRPCLPLVAIPRARCVVDIEFESLAILGIPENTPIGVSVLTELVDVDDAEKKRLMRPVRLLFESVIDADGLSYRLDSDGDILDVETIVVDMSRAAKAVKYLAWVAYEDTAPLFTYLPHPLAAADILFGGVPREREKHAGYYDTYQRYTRCKTSRPDGLGVYSFALDATSRLPTGTADFAALVRPSLRGIVRRPNPRFRLKVFAVSYNSLDIDQGTVRVVFT